MRILLLLAVLLFMWAQIPGVSPNHEEGGNSTHDSGGGGTSSPDAGSSSPDAGSSDFHVSLYPILIAGASVLMVLKLFGM